MKFPSWKWGRLLNWTNLSLLFPYFFFNFDGYVKSKRQLCETAKRSLTLMTEQYHVLSKCLDELWSIIVNPLPGAIIVR